ncbi:MAG: blue light sensor protein [Betaproteobacteria bacterium]|nr:blue light sensor protein [Betaproteobacteria bacterium]
MVQLVYSSQPTKQMASRDLMEILDVARERNQDARITGLLCYAGSHFLQVLEGERKQVCETFYRIADDERHSDVTIIDYNYPPERLFTDWTMGYAGLGEIRRELIRRHAPDGEVASLLPDAGSVMAFVRDVAHELSHGFLSPD